MFMMLSTCLVSLFAFAFVSPQAAAPQQSPPSAITVAPPVAELGAVAPGSTTPAKFVLINTSSKPITVTSAVPNCKCTAISEVKGKTIPAGGTLELSAALAAPHVPGPKEATVFLTFDSTGPVQAKIKGEVRLPVLSTPPYIEALKQVTRGTVKLRSADGKPFSVLRSGGKAPAFVGFDASKDAPRAEYEIVWDFGATPCESMPLWWFVFTDRADCEFIPLRVRNECTGSTHDRARFQRFWIVKEQLVLATQSVKGKAAETEFELEHYNPPKRGAVERADWRMVRSVRSLSPEVEVKYLSRRDVGNDGAMVKIEMIPKVAGPIEGLLEIETATGVGRVPFAMFARQP